MTNPLNRGKMMMEESGRVGCAETGSREPSPSSSGLGPSGFDPARRLEFSPDHKGRFDEIVARFADGMVHVETMTKKGCYVGFYWDDGRYCQWWINSDKKLEYHHEDGQTDPPRFTAWGIDRTPSRLAIAMEARRGGTPKSDPTAEGDDSAGGEAVSPKGGIND